MQPIHELAPITARSANLLASAYGFPSIKQFADDIPDGGAFLDVGSGRSPFGAKIATLRPDVSVVLMDRAYPGDHRDQQRPNLRWLHGDILEPPEEIGPFDRITCSALLPHIAMSSPELAVKAIHNMANLLQSKGTLQVAGFIGISSFLLRGRAETISAEGYEADPDREAITAATNLILSPSVAAMQRAINLLNHDTGYTSWQRLRAKHMAG